jgi:hypothetical protein
VRGWSWPPASRQPRAVSELKSAREASLRVGLGWVPVRAESSRAWRSGRERACRMPFPCPRASVCARVVSVDDSLPGRGQRAQRPRRGGERAFIHALGTASRRKRPQRKTLEKLASSGRVGEGRAVAKRSSQRAMGPNMGNSSVTASSDARKPSADDRAEGAAPSAPPAARCSCCCCCCCPAPADSDIWPGHSGRIRIVVWGRTVHCLF